MGWSELSKIDLKSRENVVLCWKRWHPVVYTLVIGALLAASVFGVLLLIDPSYRSGEYHGRGAWLIALFALLPFAVRIVLVSVLIGLLMEGLFRYTHLIYGELPAYVIGPDGIAILLPWNPRALTWREIRECKRMSSQDVFGNETGVWLSFRAPDRMINITPYMVGMTEEEVVKIIERFAGRIVFDHETYV